MKTTHPLLSAMRIESIDGTIRPKFPEKYSKDVSEIFGAPENHEVVVEFSALEELKKSIVIAIPRGNGKGHSLATVDIEYEWSPPRCSRCMVFDHNSDKCPTLPKVVAPVNDTTDGFTEVKRKNLKAKQNQKNKKVEGVRLSKPALNLQYRRVEKGDTSKRNDQQVDNIVNPKKHVPKPHAANPPVSELNVSNSDDEVDEEIEVGRDGNVTSNIPGASTPVNDSHASSSNLHRLCSLVFKHWDWTSNGSWCLKGTRIIMGWNRNDVDVVGALYMVREVSFQEVKDALFSMGDDKSPGPDGFTAAFFKETWSVTGNDVYNAVCEFFRNGTLLKEVNHTIIALLPKVKSPSRINDYRPISCCNVLFKCLSKIIANRIKQCLKHIVSPISQLSCQGNAVAFVKVTLFRRTYLRLLWRYCSKLELVNLCFADDLFLFAYGDVHSVSIIKEALDEFKLSILQVLPFEEGTLPVKYLGVPLVSSRLKIRDCNELVDRVQLRISDWKNKSLSIVGGANIFNRFEFNGEKLAAMEQYVVWYDKWTDLDPLATRISPRDIHNAGLSFQSKVSDIVVQGSWVWPHNLSSKYSFLNDYVTPVHDEVLDRMVWRNRQGRIENFSVSQVCYPQEVKNAGFNPGLGFFGCACMSKRSTDQLVECVKASVRLKLLSCKLKKSSDGERMARLWDLPEVSQ
ncbi:hypothetical protein Tco_0676724 [Tanacetum coccineum]